MPRFSEEEIQRYAPQMVLPEIGGVGQKRLRDAQAVARDEVEALYLAAAGVGRLTVPNEAIAGAVRALNPLIEVTVSSIGCAGGDVAAQALRALAQLRETLGL